MKDTIMNTLIDIFAYIVAGIFHFILFPVIKCFDKIKKAIKVVVKYE